MSGKSKAKSRRRTRSTALAPASRTTGGPDGPAGLIVAQSASFSGPIPPPAILHQYDAVIPGAAERILKMAEEQSKHRQELVS